jgi:hypothetical protein
MILADLRKLICEILLGNMHHFNQIEKLILLERENGFHHLTLE